MSKVIPCALFAVLLASLAASPAMAKSIPPGTDYWRTPANGLTAFEFPEGDVESLCGLGPSGDWDHKVGLQGVPTPGSDWDTAVARLDTAKFDSAGNASVRIQVKALSFTSMAPHQTPCGVLRWTVGLACCPQPITRMRLTRTQSKSGFFSANLSVAVEFKAYDAKTGALLGSLFYTRELPDTSAGVPWSLGPSGEFRPGMTETDNCIGVLRDKLSQYDPTSSHFYFISDLIAQGKCERN